MSASGPDISAVTSKPTLPVRNKKLHNLYCDTMKTVEATSSSKEYWRVRGKLYLSIKVEEPGTAPFPISLS